MRADSNEEPDEASERRPAVSNAERPGHAAVSSTAPAMKVTSRNHEKRCCRCS